MRTSLPISTPWTANPWGVILDDDGLQQRDAARGGVHSDGIYQPGG